VLAPAPPDADAGMSRLEYLATSLAIVVLAVLVR
jgi:hypothetical protein